jgi:hypothetical protein
MRATLVVKTLAVSLLCCAGAFAQEMQRPLQRSIQRPIDVQPIDIASEYASIRTLSSAEVREAYRAMPSSERKALWTEHLVTFLREHPELDAAQRGIVLEGLGLLATGIFDLDPSDVQARALAGKEIERVVTRAKELLPSDLAWTAFYGLNGGSQSEASSRQGRLRRLQTNAPFCDCSSALGCEDTSATCVPRTGPGFCSLVPSYNCGPYYYYACDGLCQYP